jgi:TonB family protein
MPQIKIQLLLLVSLVSVRVSCQTDTILYFSDLQNPVKNLEEASYYEKLTKTSDNNYVLCDFKKSDKKWKKYYESKIKRQSDSSFIISEDEIVRTYHNVDSGYMIRDIKKTNSDFLSNWVGFSKRLFPLIRSGVWKSYNPLTGDIGFENIYRDNLLISNKYWINDTTYINNVYISFNEPPEYQGGESALMDLLYSNIDYPFEAKIRNIQGKVVVGFVILNNGQMVGLKVQNLADKSLAREAIRIVNLSENKWKPAKIGDKNVNALIYIPVTFHLQ